MTDMIIALGITILVLIVECTTASSQLIDGPVAREHLERQVSALLYQENFSELERMATDFRTNKSKFPDGTSKLRYYYGVFSAPKSSTLEGWKRFFAKLDAWLQKYPKSITARVAAAEAWIGYGAEARGSGFADTVTEEGWRLLHQRMEKAYSLLAKKPKRPSDDCPHRYDLLLIIAQYQGWTRPQYEALFHEAITFDPSYQVINVNYYSRPTTIIIPVS